MVVTDTQADVIHATWCSGRCARWLATGAPTCLPYPCRCAETKATAPQWKRELAGSGITCWWRNEAGKLTSRCPCWGATRRQQSPECCVWHAANPQYLDVPAEAHSILTDPEQADAQAADPPEPDEGNPRPADADSIVWGDEPAYEAERPKREPFVRRWRPDELVCGHDVSAIKGIHCQQCHIVFANDMVFGMHQRTWGEPCRAPLDLLDVDTGALLVLQRADGAWAIDWAANAS